MKKTIIATIIYHPDSSTFKRISGAIENGYEVYLFDNSPDINSRLFADKNVSKIRYFTFDRNVGIGTALRLMCSTAYFNGNQSVIYFDQDTIFTVDTLNFILDYQIVSSDAVNQVKLEKILSVTFRDAALNRKKGIIEKIIIGNYLLNIVDFTISSGTLFNLKNLKVIGWHNESYNIDGVDYSVCVSAEAKGLKIAEIFDTPGLDHGTGQGNRNYKFLFKTFSARKYSIYRIKDYICSSIRLITKSILINRRKTFKVLKMLIAYVSIQLILHVSKEQPDE